MGKQQIKTYLITCDVCAKECTYTSHDHKLPDGWKEAQAKVDIHSLDSYGYLIMGDDGNLGYIKHEMLCPDCNAVREVIE